MNKEDIIIIIRDILRDEFENSDLEISVETSSEDIDGWDSLRNLSIVNEIENQFNIKFTINEIHKMQSVGDFIDAIVFHMGN